jgi:hypothetical protein
MRAEERVNASSNSLPGIRNSQTLLLWERDCRAC